MKILQVNKFYAPEVGGVETVCKQYSEYLAKDHDVTVLCASRKFSLFSSNERLNGVKIIRCSSFGTFFSMPISISFLLYFVYNFIKADAIFLHLPCPLTDFALLLTPVGRKKIFAVWHSDIIKQKTLRTLLHPIFISTLKKATCIIVTSPNLPKYSSYLQRFNDKCFVLPLSVDCSYISRLVSETDEPNLVKDIGDIDALFFGRLCYYKGVNVLIDALIELKKRDSFPRVVIAGKGEYEQLIRDAIIHHDLKNVTFIDRYISEEEKYFLLQKAKCFLFPSVEASEAFGITQLEAMCLGTPVINTSLKSGVPWVSQDQVTGFTVTPKSPSELATALQKLLDDQILRESFGVAAKLRVQDNFDDQTVFGRLQNLISQE